LSSIHDGLVVNLYPIAERIGNIIIIYYMQFRRKKKSPYNYVVKSRKKIPHYKNSSSKI